MAEGGVVHPVEDPGRDGRDPAHRDVALTVARLAADHEGVRQHHRPRPRRPLGQIRPDPLHRGAEHLLVAPALQPEPLPGEGRLQVRQPVHGDRAVFVREQDGHGAAVRVSPQVDTGPVDQPGADAEAAGGVVVAADEHRRHPEICQPVQHLVEERDGVEGGQRAVVDVPRHQHGVDPLLPGHRHQVVEEGALGLVQALPVERAAEVPVGGVQKSHSRALARISATSVPCLLYT